ncbi:hypothetical protein GGX14DRAFT_555195 [Mycena pura]|uniref:Uncharacterized protein n=1 Tax=Mycena pura TaxID=153505 RepID=A0AAD7E583_9AGAR|nr:hypothetical protein GGX14DRAFT_555195 [Mycena pura]
MPSNLSTTKERNTVYEVAESPHHGAPEKMPDELAVNSMPAPPHASTSPASPVTRAPRTPSVVYGARSSSSGNATRTPRSAVYTERFMCSASTAGGYTRQGGQGEVSQPKLRGGPRTRPSMLCRVHASPLTRSMRTPFSASPVRLRLGRRGRIVAGKAPVRVLYRVGFLRCGQVSTRAYITNGKRSYNLGSRFEGSLPGSVNWGLGVLLVAARREQLLPLAHRIGRACRASSRSRASCAICCAVFATCVVHPVPLTLELLLDATRVERAQASASSPFGRAIEGEPLDILPRPSRRCAQLAPPAQAVVEDFECGVCAEERIKGRLWPPPVLSSASCTVSNAKWRIAAVYPERRRAAHRRQAVKRAGDPASASSSTGAAAAVTPANPRAHAPSRPTRAFSSCTHALGEAVAHAMCGVVLLDTCTSQSAVSAETGEVVGEMEERWRRVQRAVARLGRPDGSGALNVAREGIGTYLVYGIEKAQVQTLGENTWEALLAASHKRAMPASRNLQYSTAECGAKSS